MNIKHRNEINKMKAYVPGKPIEVVQKELGLDNVIKLASNENPLGCSSIANNAIKKALTDVAFYPDGNSGDLKTALAKHYNLAKERFIIGAGSDEIIGLLSQVFLNRGEELLTSEQSFPRYDSAAHLIGGEIIKVPLKNFTYDLASMRNYVTSKTKMVVLANPNNPTGTYFTDDNLTNFMDNIPDDILVVLDEAYFEYVQAEDYPDSINKLSKYNNLIVLRTFSKAYGLAGLRVGYGIAHTKIIELVNRVRNPFNVNTLGQKAAIASLDDKDFLDKVLSLNNEVKDYVYRKLDEMDIEYIPTQANFIMIKSYKDVDTVLDEFQAHGLIIRPAFGVPDYIRVTLGTMYQMTEFIKTISKIYEVPI